MKACYVQEMRDIDRSAEELGGIPSIVLMENAAVSCVQRILSLNSAPKRIAVFCGRGNNGGDGFAIARQLINRGIDTDIYLVCGYEFSKDALINYEILSKMGANIYEVSENDDLKYKIMSCDVVIDAIFGSGLHGEITGIAGDCIGQINAYSEFTFAVDIPSGVNGDTGEVSGACIKADVTSTFAAYKVGMLEYPGADYCGRVYVENISIPNYLLEHININIPDNALISEIMPKRTNDSHKGDYGKLLIVGGSVGMTGAVALAASAAQRCGTGLITAAVPESVNPILEVKLTEPMTYPLKSRSGSICREAIDEIKEKMSGADALLFGPGIGRGEDIVEILREILKFSQIPIILDADGLYALSKDMDMLSHCGCNLIFTPHEMEFSRISGHTLEEIHKNRLELSEKFAAEFGVTLVLKGAKTVICAPDGTQYINILGNNGMATGGSGDVLAGMIAAFCARGVREEEAAVLGTYFHSAAADKAAETVGKNALAPTDIIDSIHLILPVE